MLMNQQELLCLAVNAAIVAGEEIIEVYSREFTVEIKEDKSPLTEADKRANGRIMELLASTGLPVMSEEGRSIPFGERSAWKTLWIVDPLDGTKEFIKRNGEFTVNIALIDQGQPVAGVVYAPVLGLLYFGGAHLGSYRIRTDSDTSSIGILKVSNWDQLLSLSEQLPLERGDRPYRVVASRSHMSEETAGFIDQLRKEHAEVELISKGSSLKICLVAEGTADVYPRFAPTMEWDIAAGHAVALGAGKSLVRTHDRMSMQYNREELLNPWFIVR